MTTFRTAREIPATVEQVFAAIEAPGTVVIQLVSEPKFQLTILLVGSGAGTLVDWSQEFGSAELAGRIEHSIVPANEQNLDRLTAEVLG